MVLNHGDLVGLAFSGHAYGLVPAACGAWRVLVGLRNWMSGLRGLTAGATGGPVVAHSVSAVFGCLMPFTGGHRVKSVWSYHLVCDRRRGTHDIALAVVATADRMRVEVPY